MKIKFLQKNIDKAPKAYTRIKIAEGDVKRFVKERGVDTLEIGAGKRADVTQRKFILLCRQIVQSAKQNKCRKIALPSDFLSFPRLKDVPSFGLSRIAAENFHMANFEYTQYKTKPKEGWPDILEILICGKTSRETQKGVAEGAVAGRHINACRTLSNTPAGDMTPQRLYETTRMAARGLKVKVRALQAPEMRRLGMGGVLGVGKGSAAAPRFIIAEYRGGKRGEKPIVLVGKGVTFDSGGLNLKPEAGIYEMHLDMSGGAAVLEAVLLAAELKTKRNVIALVPAVENMISGESYRPGDMLVSLSGKTIEVLNTDAEGRIVLADAITYAGRFKPSLVVDVATLTGASLIALGQQASAILTRDADLERKVRQWGESSGDYVWPLPLWDEYEDLVKGNFGDVANIPSSGNNRYGGVIGGGMFLWQFAKELSCPWLHIDMAPRMTSAPNEFLAKGAAGAPVRLLLSIIKNY